MLIVGAWTATLGQLHGYGPPMLKLFHIDGVQKASEWVCVHRQLWLFHKCESAHQSGKYLDMWGNWHVVVSPKSSFVWPTCSMLSDSKEASHPAETEVYHVIVHVPIVSHGFPNSFTLCLHRAEKTEVLSEDLLQVSFWNICMYACSHLCHCLTLNRCK